MKKTSIHYGFGVFALALLVSFATQASARHFISSECGSVKIESVPTVSAFGTFNNAGVGYIGMLRIPAPQAIFDGGHDGHGDPDDSTGGDSLGGPRDTSHHGGDRGDDTSGGHHGDNGDTTGGRLGDGDRDSTGGDGDTTHHLGGGPGDTTGCGDRGDGDRNDTIDCGHHHHHDDSTDVSDSTKHSLFGGSHQSIVIKSNGQKTTVSFVFTNNLTTSVQISDMKFASGQNFSIVNGAPTLAHPATLTSGASINLTIAFTASDNTPHTDQLIVISNSAQALNTISLQGQVTTTAASVLNSLPAGVTITAMPNPMTSYLKIDLAGVSNASVAIYDMRGNSVLNSSLSSNEWIWNGQATDGSILPAGSYIVRLSGVSSANEAFISTQKIILAR